MQSTTLLIALILATVYIACAATLDSSEETTTTQAPHHRHHHPVMMACGRRLIRLIVSVCGHYECQNGQTVLLAACTYGITESSLKQECCPDLI